MHAYRKRHPHPSFLSSCHLFKVDAKLPARHRAGSERGDPPGIWPLLHRVPDPACAPGFPPLTTPLCSSRGSVPSILSSDCPGHRDSHPASLFHLRSLLGVSSDFLALSPSTSWCLQRGLPPEPAVLTSHPGMSVWH